MRGVTIIGAGLAGCEAAWVAAERGVQVFLYEMKPQRFSPAHASEGLAELVCSNSLRGADLSNAVGLLKEELRRCGSLIMQAADATKVPAGGALAVDRDLFSVWITERIASHPNITLIREELTCLPPEGLVVIASGPLTSDALAEELARLVGERLYFYDAIAPIVTAESLDLSKIYAASRYGKGDPDDYLNCPMDGEQYTAFITAVKAAEKVAPREFEKLVHFDGCMPIEEMAERGDDTLRFGPMKPVGLPDPTTGKDPYAVVQLRSENNEKTLYNLVGFQTRMTWPEQRRVLRMIPGLEQAEFARLGVMHRNTFINAPTLLEPTQQLTSDPRILFAGQITGVEGYVESAGSGFLAGLAVAALVSGEKPSLPPRETALGALIYHVTNADPKHFQPMNVNYGLFPSLESRVKKKDRKLLLAERALVALDEWKKSIETRSN
jgi:methylenetetrahydrofolate--tRNA-(uracil-5-)-methyltransferase